MARLDFANYNFDQLVTQLRAIVKAEDAWKDISVESGTGNFLVELFSYVAEMLMYYLERRAQETYIDTAQLRSSIVRLVSLLNYRPKRKTSATGYLTFTLPGGWHDGNIFLPKGTAVLNADGTRFMVKNDEVLRRGLTSVTVEGIQGINITEVVTSDGTANQEITINDTAVEDTNISVVVDGELWEMVDNFVNSNADSHHYKQETNLSDQCVLVFGDGTFGQIPAYGVDISIQYIQSAGLTGNVYSPGAINAVDSTIFDEYNVDVTDLLTVSNSSLFLGGDDAEDKEEIRREAPLVFKTGDRAVSREDFISIIENIPGVQTAYVWGERDELPAYWMPSTAYNIAQVSADIDDNSVWQCAVGNTSGTGSMADDRLANPTWWTPLPYYSDITMFNKVRIVCLLQNWVNPDAAFKKTIADALINKEQLTVWLEFLDASMVETIMDLSIKVLPTYQSSTIVSNVSTALDAEFALGTVKLGQAVRLGDVYQTIENIVGVDYSHVDFSHREILGTGDGFNYTFPLATMDLMMAPVKRSSVKIYVDAVQVGSDNGLGYIIGAHISGAIAYTSGRISVTFAGGYAPALGAVVRAYYQQDEGGDLIVGRQEIIRLVEKNITLL